MQNGFTPTLRLEEHEQSLPQTYGWNTQSDCHMRRQRRFYCLEHAG